MKTALVVVLLVLVTACGSTPAKSSPVASTSTSATTAPANGTCVKLGRTWAVKAENLRSSLLLGASAIIKGATTAMTNATDQMKIEGCKDPFVAKALDGNYRAALAATKALICVENNTPSGMCNSADREWRRNGEPILATVRQMVGLS